MIKRKEIEVEVDTKSTLDKTLETIDKFSSTTGEVADAITTVISLASVGMEFYKNWKNRKL